MITTMRVAILLKQVGSKCEDESEAVIVIVTISPLHIQMLTRDDMSNLAYDTHCDDDDDMDANFYCLRAFRPLAGL